MMKTLPAEVIFRKETIFQREEMEFNLVITSGNSLSSLLLSPLLLTSRLHVSLFRRHWQKVTEHTRMIQRHPLLWNTFRYYSYHAQIKVTQIACSTNSTMTYDPYRGLSFLCDIQSTIFPEY